MNLDSFSNALHVTFPGVTRLLFLEPVDGHKGHFLPW